MVSRRLRIAACMVAAGVGEALLITNAMAVRAGRPPLELVPRGSRYWEDVRSAAASLRGVAPASAASPVRAYPDRFTRALAAETERLRIDVTEFWRTLPDDRIPTPSDGSLTPLEDVGRARVLAVCFRALGGVAPWLLLWIPALLAAPALAALALAWEGASRPVTAVLLPVIIGASAFFADALFLAYSPAGFYLVGLVVLAAFSAWAAGDGALESRPAHLVVAAGGGLLLALCAACRSGTLMLLPGFVVAGAILIARRPRAGRAAAGAIAALLVLPPIVFRPSEAHALWIGVWQGLGDFDRRYGHVWSDSEANRFLEARGLELRSPEAETTMRDIVLADIRDDPAWYAAILLRRVRAVFLQDKLAPWHSPEAALSAPFGPGEGALASYYKLTRHADTFAFGLRAIEVPTWVLWGPPAVLAILAVGGPRLRLQGAAHYRRDALALLPLAIGALAVPVAISTAGAIETQAFVLVHFTAAGLLGDAALRAARRAAGPPSGRSWSPPPGPAHGDRRR